MRGYRAVLKGRGGSSHYELIATGHFKLYIGIMHMYTEGCTKSSGSVKSDESSYKLKSTDCSALNNLVVEALALRSVLSHRIAVWVILLH